MEYEEVLRRVGKFGSFQKRVIAMVFFAGIPNAFPSIMFAYTQYEPNYHCAPPNPNNFPKNSPEYQDLLNKTIPWETDRFGIERRSRCEMYGFQNYPGGRNGSNKIPCNYGWDYEDKNTAIAEFDLVCQNAWKAPLAVTLYMVGMGMAAISGALADRLGRRPVFLFFTFGQFLFTAVVASSWNYVSYAATTLAVGLFGLVNYVVAYVFATEMLGIKKRLQAGMIACMAYGVGYCISPILGYLFPQWRWYLRSNSLLGLLYLPLYWFFPESLRWLLVGKKESEAKKLIARIAKENGKTVDVDDIYKSFQRSYEKEEENKTSLMRDRKFDLTKESSFFYMLRNRTMLVRCLVVCSSWFVSSMLYFAISLNPSQLSGNRLINIFLSGIVEFPAFFMAYYFPRSIGRVRTTVLFLAIGGSCSVIAPFLRKISAAAVTTFVLVGKCAVTGAFDVVYLVSSETSPTLVRTTSLGVASISARIGGIIMPYVLYAGDSVDDVLPFVGMGSAALLSAVLCLFFIPETRNVPMPDSIAKAVGNKRIYGLHLCKRFEEEKFAEEEKSELRERGARIA